MERNLQTVRLALFWKLCSLLINFFSVFFKKIKSMDLLDGLPGLPTPFVVPKQKDKRTRGPTRTSIPIKDPLLIDFKDILENEIVKIDDTHSKTNPTTFVPTGSKCKESILIRVAMEQRSVKMRTVPTLHRKNNRNLGETTKISCYWCRHTFKSKPVGCPRKYDRFRNTFIVEGVFCSYSCAKAYGINCKSESLRFCGSLLLLMRKKIDKISLNTPLISSPHWSTLKAYGGYYTIQEYRKAIKNSIRTKCIPQSLRVYTFGFNIFDLNTSLKKKSTYETLKRKEPSYSYLKDKFDQKLKNKRNRMGKSTTKLINKIQASSVNIKKRGVKNIARFISRSKKPKKIISI